MNVQIRNTGWSYDLLEITAPKSVSGQSHDKDEFADPELTRFHRVDVDLAGCTPFTEISFSEQLTDYQNYYTTGTPMEGALLVRSFQLLWTTC